MKVKAIAEKHGYLDSKNGADLKHHYALSVRRNLLKMGREVTPGASERRFDNLEEYFRDHKFEIKQPELFDRAMELVKLAIKAQGTVPHLDT